MPYVAQGATSDPLVTDILVRSTPSGPLVDPDAGTLGLMINRPDGSQLLSVSQASLVRHSIGHFGYAWAVPVDLPVGDYAWVWDATVGGTVLPPQPDEVVVIPAGSLATSLVSLAQVRALVPSAIGVADTDLLDLVQRQESWLATQVGPLTGARTERYWPSVVPQHTYSGLRLMRRVTAATVSDNSVAVADGNIRIGRLGFRLLRVDGPWIGPVDITYTPDDLAAVTDAVIALVGLALSDQGYQGEAMGDYSYSRSRRPVSFVAERRRIVADLTGRGAMPSSIRVRGGEPIDAGRLGSWGALLNLAPDQTNRGG